MAGSVRALVFLSLAVGTGSVSLIALHSLVAGYQERIAFAKRPEDKVMVIVATRDLYPGIPIGEADLYAVQIAPRFLPEGVFLTPDHAVGRIPRERVLANEFLRADRLSDPELGDGLNTVIPRGMRAISVNIEDGAALQGLLEPGSYVDLLVTVARDDEPARKKTSEKAETRTLLQAVFVLGVDSRMRTEDTEDAKGRRGNQKPTVTLMVTPEEGEMVAHSEQTGRIVLSLRSDGDVGVAQLAGVRELRSRLDQKPVIVRPGVPVVTKKCTPVDYIGGATVVTHLVEEGTGLPCDEVPSMLRTR